MTTHIEALSKCRTEAEATDLFDIDHVGQEIAAHYDLAAYPDYGTDAHTAIMLGRSIDAAIKTRTAKLHIIRNLAGLMVAGDG